MATGLLAAYQPGQSNIIIGAHGGAAAGAHIGRDIGGGRSQHATSAGLNPAFLAAGIAIRGDLQMGLTAPPRTCNPRFSVTELIDSHHNGQPLAQGCRRFEAQWVAKVLQIEVSECRASKRKRIKYVAKIRPRKRYEGQDR